MKGLKFVKTIKITFEKPFGDLRMYKTAYFNSQPQIIINNEGITKALEMTTQEILNKVARWISEGSGWSIKSVDNHC